MANGVDRLNRQHGPFKSGHTVGRDRYHHEFQHGVLPYAVPGAPQGQQAIQHTAPGWRDQHDGKDRTQRLSPIGQRGVQQVVGAGPDVDEDQGPEVDDRQLIGKDRAVSGLGQIVIHQAKIGGGQEESHGIMPVPPLDEGILYAGEQRVALPKGHRKFQVVADVKHRNGHPGGNVEPDGHIQVLLPPLQNGAEHVDPKGDPYQRDGNVDGPFQLGVLMRTGDAQRKRNGRRQNDGLPAPEVELVQKIAVHARFQKALQRVIDSHENSIAHKCEDRCIGVQRADAAKGGLRYSQVECRVYQLQGCDQAHKNAYRTENDRRIREFPDDGIVVTELLNLCH